MKSYNHLFEKLISHENLYSAIIRSAKRKRKRVDVQKVLSNPDKYIKKVQDLLINKEFCPKIHEAKVIQDGFARKKRIIIQPDYIYEQIVHHAVVQIIQPIFMKGMYEFSCGSIPDRGGHYGKRHVEKFIKRNPKEIKYVLKLDIKKYFQSVNIDLIKAKLKKIVHDEKMLWVLNTVLDSNITIFEGQEVNAGLPIGFYTSQWFANWFLQDLDHFIKEKLKAKCYVRYIDDIVIFGRNKKELHKIHKEIENQLKSLNLNIKENWQVFRFDYIDHKDGKRKGRPLDYMGFKFYRDKTIIRKTIMLKATKKAAKMNKKGAVTWYDACQLLSYMGWFKRTKTHGVYEKFIAPNVSVAKCRKIISARQKTINKGVKENAIRMEKGGKPQQTS